MACYFLSLPLYFSFTSLHHLFAFIRVSPSLINIRRLMNWFDGELDGGMWGNRKRQLTCFFLKKKKKRALSLSVLYHQCPSRSIVVLYSLPHSSSPHFLPFSGSFHTWKETRAPTGLHTGLPFIHIAPLELHKQSAASSVYYASI